MAMTFIVPGSDGFRESGFQRSSRFRGQQRYSHRLHDRKFEDETVEATQFAGEYDFKDFGSGEVLLNLAEALFERDGTISDANLNGTIQLLRGRVGMPC